MTAPAVIHNGNGNANGVSPGVLAPTASLVLPERDEIRGMNVHQRIRWIIAEARSLPKSNWNQEAGFPYTGHDQIVDMLRLPLAKYGINIYQEPIPDFTREMSLGGIQHLTRVWYEYEVVNVDTPDDKTIRHNWGEALDNGDKGVNKCAPPSPKKCSCCGSLRSPPTTTPMRIQLKRRPIALFHKTAATKCGVSGLTRLAKTNASSAIS